MSTEKLGRYELITRIAIGGMAEIFRAKHAGEAGFVKELVVKRILPHYSKDENFVRMFVDEALIAAKLNHPNIVTVFDFGAVDEQYFIAMEYIEGWDLRKILRESTARQINLGQNRATQITLAVVRGLGYAHERMDKGVPLDIVHRDISPHNILVSIHGDVKIMDFGIAKAAARATHTATGVLKGKIAYMSPEQARGEPIDKQTDIFAVGACLWEMLAGQRLFVGDSEIEILEKVRYAKIPDILEFAQDTHPLLKQCLNRFLMLDKKARYQNMRQAEQDLAEALHAMGGPTQAPLESYMRALLPTDLIESPAPQFIERFRTRTPVSLLPEDIKAIDASVGSIDTAAKTSFIDLSTLAQKHNRAAASDIIHTETEAPLQHTSRSFSVLRMRPRTKTPWILGITLSLVLVILASVAFAVKQLWPIPQNTPSLANQTALEQVWTEGERCNFYKTWTLTCLKHIKTQQEKQASSVHLAAPPAAPTTTSIKDIQKKDFLHQENHTSRTLKENQKESTTDISLVTNKTNTLKKEPIVSPKPLSEPLPLPSVQTMVSFINCAPGTQVFLDHRKLEPISSNNQRRYLLPIGRHQLRLTSPRQPHAAAQTLLQTNIQLKPAQIEMIECPAMDMKK